MAAFAGNYPPCFAVRQDNGHAQAGAGADHEAPRAVEGFSLLQGEAVRGR
jgi:hypothetical protein